VNLVLQHVLDHWAGPATHAGALAQQAKAPETGRRAS
jgi:hypothetical protein